MISRKKEIYITPTPEELAEEFCEMGCDQQAAFFNQIAKNIANWDNPFCFQLHNIKTSDVLTLDGRWVMEQIGIYSKPLSDEKITKNLKVKNFYMEVEVNSLGEVWFYFPKVLGKEYAINMGQYNKKGTLLGDLIQGILQENAVKKEKEKSNV